MSTHPAPPPSYLMTCQETAAYLRISRAYLFILVREGRLPAPLKLGRLNRWSRIEIDAWIAAGSPDSAMWEASYRRAPSSTPLNQTDAAAPTQPRDPSQAGAPGGATVDR